MVGRADRKASLAVSSKVDPFASRRRTITFSPADDAGEFRGFVADGEEIDRLLIADEITIAMADAARLWFADWYASGVGGHGASWREFHGGTAQSLVEQMNERQEASWRSYRDGLERMPICVRQETSAVVMMDARCRDIGWLRTGLSCLTIKYRNEKK